MSAIATDWLDCGAALTTSGGGASTGSHSNCIDYGQHYWPFNWTIRTDEPVRPIRLSMAEVERLRKAAKADDALKAILKKFTAQIEVVVEF